MIERAKKRVDFKMNSRGNSNQLISSRWSEKEVALLASMRSKLKEQLNDQTPYPDGFANNYLNI